MDDMLYGSGGENIQSGDLSEEKTLMLLLNSIKL